MVNTVFSNSSNLNGFVKMDRNFHFGKLITCGVFALMLSISLFIIIYHMNNEQFFDAPVIEIFPENTYNETLRVAADRDCQPYSFVLPDGTTSGFDVELLALLANRLHMNLDLQLMDRKEAVKALKSGRVDMIAGLDLADRKITEKKSLPVSEDPFVVFGFEKAEDINDLYGSRIAVIEGSEIPEFLKMFGLERYCRICTSCGDTFRSLISGESDFAVCRYSVGRFIINQYRTGNIQTGFTILGSCRCYGFSDRSGSLNSKVNDCLISLIQDRSVPELREKWLGSYVDVQFVEEYIRNHSDIIIGLIVTFIILLLVYIIISAKIFASTENRLKKIAETDQLTGLNNKTAADYKIKSVISSWAGEPETLHALLIIDMDHFKDVNDSLGHQQGDVVLKTMSQRLKALFRENDILGRMGGDEFYVFMKNINSREIAEKKAGQICEVFRNSYSSENILCTISASVGVAFFPENGKDFETLYSKADEALYRSKKGGRDRYTVWS